MNPPKDVLTKESYLSKGEIATRFKHNLKDIGNQYNPRKKGLIHHTFPLKSSF